MTRFGSLSLLLGAALLLAALPATAAEPSELVNTIRMAGCQGRPGAGMPLQRREALDEVARRLAQGERLAAALAGGGYEAVGSTSIHVSGSRSAEAIERVLREGYCEAITRPAFTELGVFQRGTDTWLVLAEPFAPPAAADQQRVAREVLELVNAARAKPRRCGRHRFAAVAPLALSEELAQAALAHATDMAARGVMGHRGGDGSRPEERVTRSGYAWRATGENVAAGQPDAAAVVAHWLASPGHCANLMDAQYTEMGVAFALAPRDSAGIYWAQVFARPQ